MYNRYVNSLNEVVYMPFKSKQQAKWMFANKPEMAKKWAKETPDISKLPKRKKNGIKKQRRNSGRTK